MKKVIGVGACVLDTLIECDAYPVEDKKSRANLVMRTGGGPVANALVVCSKMGVESEFLGALSNDADGEFLIAEFNRYGVGTKNVKKINDTKAFVSYVLLSKSSASRTCVFNRGNVPDNPKDINLSAIDGADVLHLDGNYLKCAIECAKYAKSKGVLVSLDAGGNYDGIEKLLPYVDILIPSEEFALSLTKAEKPEQAINILQEKYSPKVLVVTQGAKGGLYVEDGQIRKYDSFKIKCVDSNGAGDTFHGAFLVAYLNGYSIEGCCEFASATSAIKCLKVGMRDALPTFDEVLSFIKSR
jgi:sugar/nucleoside kinase (ribokinase family)